MTNSHDSTNSARLDEVLLDYLRRVDRREPVDREAFIAEHPDVAEQLRAFFADSSAVDNLLHVKPERPRASRDGPRVSALPVVRYFGDYELLEEVGRGGMGVVYKARQCSLNRTVAVKMILAGQLADEEEVRRFQAEAELAAGLDHPGIVPIFEVGRHEGQCYFSMAYVEGRSLAQEVAQAPLPPRRAAERMCRVAQAVHYAHGKGVIHRDLKPSNILLDANDQPRITDFGLAKRVAVDGGQTASGQILGSPSYMPPEQAEGRLDRIDARSDVYALGATLYHLITGRAPFQAAHVLDTLAQVRREDPLAPRQINPRLPRDLDTICLKCLEKSPHRRFSTVDEFREELQRFLDGKPILSRPVSGPERAWRWCRRNPALAALTAVMLLVGVLLGLGAPLVAWRQAVLRQQAEQAQEAAEQAQQTAEDARQTAEAAGKDAERSRQETARQAAMEKEARERALDENRRAEANLYYSRIALARQQFFANHVAEAEAHLDACAPQHRHWEWGYLKRLCHRDLWTINTNPHFVILLALSQDGKQVLCGDYDGHFRVWDAASGKELRTIVLFSADPAANSDSSRPYEPAALAVSADGKWIAGGRKTAGLWDAVTGKRAQSFDAGAIEGVAFSPDATQVAIASQGKVLVYDTATGRRQLTIAGGYHGEIVFSPDGKSLARGDSEGIRIWDTATGQDKASLKKRRPADTSTFDIAGGLAFSPDGKRIAAGCPDRAVSIWDTSTNQEVMRLTGHDQGVHHLAFSADGKRIVTAGGDQTVRVWDADTGRQVLLLRGHRHIVDKVAVSADGTRITSAGHDGTVRMWDATLEQETRTLRCDAGDLEHLAFDPRGKQLAAGAGMGGVVVWDFATGKEVFRQDSSFSVRIGEPGRHSRSKDDVPESEDDISKSEDDMPRSEDNMFGHGVVFGPDGQWLASGGSGGQVAFWQPASGKKLFTLRPSSSAGLVETSSISNVALRPDGKRIALAGDDVIVVWDIATRRQVLSIRESGPAGNETTRNPLAFMQQVQFSPDGRTIAAQTPRGGVKTWDAVTGKEIGVIPTQEGVLDLAFSPDSRLLAIADTDVVVWDLAKRRKVAQFGGRSGHGVPCLAFSPDGRRLACDAGDALEIREVGSWREVLSLPRSASMLWRLAFSPDGSCIAAAGDNGTATVWQGMTSMEMTGGATVVPAAEPAATPPPAARLSVPEAKPEKGSPPPEDEAEEKPMDLDGDDPPNDMPEDKPSAAPPGNAADAPARTTVRQPEGNAPAAQRNAKVPVAPEVGPEIRLELRHQVKAVCVSPDESWVALTGDDETVEIWDLRTKGQRLAFHAHKDGVNDIAVSADGKRLVTAGKDGFARVWDAATGKPLLEVTANTQHPRHVTAAAFRPDGRQFATAAEHRITLWDATSGAPSLTLEPPVGSVGFRESVLHLAFDASGKQLASATFQEGTRVWDAVQGGMIAQVGKDQRSSIAPAFSPDGKQLASGGENGTVTIWDLATGKPVHKLPKCRGDAGCLAFRAYPRTTGRLGT
jgi:WD40 repeat protein